MPLSYVVGRSMMPAKRIKHDIRSTPINRLNDLPTTLGGNVTSFLFVEEQCKFMRISKTFERYTKYGFRMERDQLIVLYDARQPRKKNFAKLQKMAELCPRSRCIGYLVTKMQVHWHPHARKKEECVPCRLVCSTGMMRDWAEIYVLDICKMFDLNKVATLACAKHIHELQLDVRDEKDVGQFHAHVFKDLKTVGITTEISQNVDKRLCQHLELIRNTWKHISQVHLSMRTWCHDFSVLPKTGATEVEVLREWKNLQRLEVVYQVHVGRMSIWEENAALRNFYEALDLDVACLSATMDIFDYGNFGHLDHLVDHAMAVIRSTFSHRSVSVYMLRKMVGKRACFRCIVH